MLIGERVKYKNTNHFDKQLMYGSKMVTEIRKMYSNLIMCPFLFVIWWFLFIRLFRDLLSWTRESLRCIILHNKNRFVQRVILFLSSFAYHGLYILWATMQVFLEKAEDAYPIGASSPCCQFVAEPELLICFYFLIRVILFVACLFPCLIVILRLYIYIFFHFCPNLDSLLFHYMY